MDTEKKKDQLVEVFLYNPHVCDFIWQRPDGTYYADRRNHGQMYVDVQKIDGKWEFGAMIDVSTTNHG